MTKNVGVILAGGVGVRMNLGYPKQFSKIAGKTTLEHTISTFQNHPEIDVIIVVSEPNHYDKISEIITKAHFTKVEKIIYGGEKRTDSTLSSLHALQTYPDETKLIIHDSVRPLITAEIISNCITKLDTYNAVDVVIQATDTIVKVDNNTKEIIEIPKRDNLYQGQTPQAFRLGTLTKAYEIYSKNDISATCDCGIILKTMPAERIAIVEGSETNIKLTRPVDLFLADKLFQSRSNFTLKNMTSIEQLCHLDKKVMVIFGGSYGIGSDIVQIAKKLGISAYSFSRSTGVDITNLESIKQALQSVHEKEGTIDYIVNSAALLIHKPLSLMSLEEVHCSIDTNYTGAVNVTLAAFPYLKNSKGSLLNFTSSSYTRGRPFYSIYSSTKAAIVNLTQALSEEWASLGININCINPERTKTPMRESNFGIEPENTLLNPKTVALASIIVLASKETGNIIDVKLQDEKDMAIVLNTVSSN